MALSLNEHKLILWLIDVNTIRIYIIYITFSVVGFAAVIVHLMADNNDWLNHNQKKIVEYFAVQHEDPRWNDYGLSDKYAVQLGEEIFFDKRFSRSGKLSCASCHQPERLWTDGLQLAIGTRTLSVNTPTLIGVHRLKWLFWDGRAIGLAHQALQPMRSAAELGIDARGLLQVLGGDKRYSVGYQYYFGSLPDPTCLQLDNTNCSTALKFLEFNTARLIAAFVASIPSPNTRFDHFLSELQHGMPPQVFSSQEIRGLRLFIEKGSCIACHSGNDLTDGQFHNVLVPEITGPGVFSPGRYAGIREAKTNIDLNYASDNTYDLLARVEILRARTDSSMYAAFKTPTLRGLRCTGPYMHNGSFSSIKAVVEHYSSFEHVIRPDHYDDPLVQPRLFSADEQDDLIAFLLTLSPELDVCGQTSRQ